MWSYEKRLQYPVKIKNPDPAMAKIIITQLGGPDIFWYKEKGSHLWEPNSTLVLSL